MKNYLFLVLIIVPLSQSCSPVSDLPSGLMIECIREPENVKIIGLKHANMMALAFDLVPDKYKQTVIDFIKSRGMACSVYGAQYLLEGLFNAGSSDYAFKLLTATQDRGWWNMIKTGSTITLEAWDMKYKPNSDWNHAWGAAPANIIPRHMWGIVPSAPGFSKAVIKPELNNLSFSKIEVPTIRENIKA